MVKQNPEYLAQEAERRQEVEESYEDQRIWQEMARRYGVVSRDLHEHVEEFGVCGGADTVIALAIARAFAEAESLSEIAAIRQDMRVAVERWC